MERQKKIIEGSPTAAIYARKSKATEKGESIENQIGRCISLCEMREWGYVVFYDYDYSGQNTDRPDFEEMMKRVYDGEFKYLVCYKLDRVSRSVSDFSRLISEMDSIGVAFISIKENFDLTTPMGRAMMMITAVFAQLERETIAERVRDNMIDRAKMGKWNGGPVPMGYKAKQYAVQKNDHIKKMTKLLIAESEAKTIKALYDMYLTPEGSIRKCCFWMNENGYRTKRGAEWSQSQIARILQNPLYCIADRDAYAYYSNHMRAEIVDDKKDFDGKHGLMFYNRRKPYKKTTRVREEDEWLLVIGEHEGIIPGKVFAKAQLKREQRKTQAPRSGQSVRSPLAGLIRCGRCGAAMITAGSKKNVHPGSAYNVYFACGTRRQKSKELCDNNSVRADDLEKMVVKCIAGLLENEKALDRALNTANDKLEDRRIPLLAKRNKLQSQIDSLDSELKNLVNALGKGILPEYVIKNKYKELDRKKDELVKTCDRINEELDQDCAESYDMDAVKEHIKNFGDSYQYLSLEEKKKLLRSIVKEIIIDKNKATLILYFLPGKEYNLEPDPDDDTFCSCKDMGAGAKHKTIRLYLKINDPSDLPESTLGDRIRKLRIEKDMTISELAEKCEISADTLQGAETGRRFPNISTINKISKILDTANKYLFESLPEDTPAHIIKKYRLINGWTQRDLASASGIKNGTIAAYETGQTKGAAGKTLKKIYKVLGYKK